MNGDDSFVLVRLFIAIASFFHRWSACWTISSISPDNTLSVIGSVVLISGLATADAVCVAAGGVIISFDLIAGEATIRE